MSYFKTTLVIGLCLALCLTANPIHRVRALDYAPAKGLQPIHKSRSQFETSNNNGKLCNSSDRSCELHRRTKDFNTWRARPHELIFLAPHAGLVLRDFYHAILTQVDEQWSLQAPVPRFWIRQKDLKLYFRSVGGPTPWSIVARLAYRLLRAIQWGWTCLNDRIHQNSAAAQGVVGTLHVANNQFSVSLQQHPAKPTAAKNTKRTDLTKRSDFRLICSRHYSEILPLSIAAPYAKAFFDAIAVTASTAWTSRPQTALLAVTQSPFQLTVSCLGAHIPWSLLASAAQHFSALADRGLVGAFDAFYQDPASASTSTIAIGLRLLTDAPTPMTISQPAKRDLQTPPTALLRPRGPPTTTTPCIRVTHFLQTAAMVPTALAAAKLEDFYTIIALKIETGQMAHKAPARTVVCALWDFELVFSSPMIDVPLSFVQAFVIEMAARSARQFSGFYEATVVGEGPLCGLVIFVQMRLKGGAGPMLGF
ncbi:hypothetical protein IMSHALPRED_004528 [Imshaugia aleurites]|uniref:Uncharacterized protein n=1 Tax=Imshaugia aleurites TaxID=172621 RepID=A0A8H3FE02_9LECA|nr:hypothetical protein IMSHALPRED_004528 [Imshaugia aleurites]